MTQNSTSRSFRLLHHHIPLTYPKDFDSTQTSSTLNFYLYQLRNNIYLMVVQFSSVSCERLCLDIFKEKLRRPLFFPRQSVFLCISSFSQKLMQREEKKDNSPKNTIARRPLKLLYFHSDRIVSPNDSNLSSQTCKYQTDWKYNI